MRDLTRRKILCKVCLLHSLRLPHILDKTHLPFFQITWSIWCKVFEVIQLLLLDHLSKSTESRMSMISQTYIPMQQFQSKQPSIHILYQCQVCFPNRQTCDSHRHEYFRSLSLDCKTSILLLFYQPLSNLYSG